MRKYLKNLKKSRKIGIEEYYRLRKEARAGQYPNLKHLIEGIGQKTKEK